MTSSVLPTKKQRELLDYIEQFIGEHGYSPSYREIMNGCQYTSVATVALHVNNLIKRGHLRKRDHSARSLEVVREVDSPSAKKTNEHESWLVGRVESYFTTSLEQDNGNSLSEGQILVRALRLLDMAEQADVLEAKLAAGQLVSVAPEKAV